MCGLVFTSSDLAPEMLSMMEHRGLDGRSKLIERDGMKFGHVRLPIQGLSDKYDQPWENGESILLYVGEIFNYKSFYDPASWNEVESDTPLMVSILGSLSQSNDPGIFHALDGFWSCVYYDSNYVHIFTDPLAKKPLYIHTGTNSVASEIRALVPLSEGKPDELYFSSVRKWGYNNGDRTPYEDIRKIPPGTHIAMDKDCKIILVETYWDLTKIRRQAEPDPKLLYRLVEQAVRNRLVSDVPVSMLVSGGLDSTIIFELLKKNHDAPINLYHIDNGEEEYLNYLELPSNATLTKLSPEYTDDELLNILVANESPVDLGSMIPQFKLCQVLDSQGESVVITGDGADELFGGYRRSVEYDSQFSDVFEELVYYHLPRLDKMSMWHTMELRSPFLAWPVVEYALTLPYGFRLNKNFLKMTFNELVPPEILAREKVALKSAAVRTRGIEWSRHLCDLYLEEMF